VIRALAACLLLLAPSLPGFSPNALPEPLSPTPRLGVALSGGGPRGRAHLGVLQTLHELRIPVDLISGTSAGSLVGGLYAQSLDLERVARELDQLDFVRLVADESIERRRLSFRERERQINYLGGLQLGLGPGGLRAPQAISSGRRLRWALRRLSAPSVGVTDFAGLPVPFRAAVTDLSRGRGAVLQHGDLAEAIMASVAVPGIFAPQHVSGAVLVDGLIFSNLPIDAVREAGTLVVVDITSLYPEGQSFHHLGAVLGGMVDTMITQNTQRQLGLLGPGDLLLRPPLEEIGNFDYHKSAVALAKGREAVLQQAERLQGMRLSEQAYAEWLAQRRALAGPSDPPRLRRLVAGPGAEPAQLAALGQREGEPLDFAALEGALEDLMGSGLYEDADYRLLPAGPGLVDLQLEPRPKHWGLSVLDLGLKLNADLEGRSEFELLLQVTQRDSAAGRQWRHQAFAGRVNGLSSELTQPLIGPLFLAPQAFVQARQVVLPGLGEAQVQRGGGGIDLGAFIGRSAELRAGWHASRLWSPQWGGYYGGIAQAVWQGLLTVDSLDDPHFPSQGSYLRAQVLDARGSLQGPSAYDLARVGLHQAFSRGRLLLLVGGEWQHSFGTALPFYEQAQLGGFLRLGGYRPGHFVGEEIWLARALLAWRQPRPGALLAKTLLYGISLEAGEAGSQPWAGGGGEAYSAAAYIGLSTLLGPFYLAHARNPQGSGVSYVYLGNPF
jgi:NTE family protein